MNQYPLWRYLLLAALIIVGVIYSLPNLYGEDPAIQISSRGGVTLPSELTTKVNDSLTSHSIPYLSTKYQPESNSILVRFKDTEAQLKAQDIIQMAIGSDYTVALNLASKTPKWLQAIGANPMRLGLDLRGGIHFLMQVDVDAMLRHREKNDVLAMGNQLRSGQIRYAGINSTGQQIKINFRKAEERDQAITLLARDYPDYTFSSSNADGQFALVATVRPEALVQWQQYAVAQNITILNNRVNELGVAEPVIQQQGKNQISVDLPGIQDTARAKDIIGKVATLRFQLQDVEHDASAAASSGIVPFGSTLYKSPEGAPVLLQNQVVLSGTSILNASSSLDQNGRPAVEITAGGSEVNAFNRITSQNIGKPMATVYIETESYKEMENGQLVAKQRQVAKVINIANIQSALGGRFQITGLPSMEAAKNLALLLRSGAYPAPVTFVQERLVGPSLGKQNIQHGIVSMEVGTLLVVIFMALYYGLFGIIADLALILNVVFVVAIMSMLGATLTMPGMAALVLTVGMAVDANVLINERIREELRNGVSPQASIHAGYERAFSTIVDANVSTLIVAVVVLALGTGSVKGFAVTLIIGLLTSMVTAIFFTRALVNLIYGRRSVKSLSIGIRLNAKQGSQTPGLNGAK